MFWIGIVECTKSVSMDNKEQIRATVISYCRTIKHYYASTLNVQCKYVMLYIAHMIVEIAHYIVLWGWDIGKEVLFSVM